MQNVVTVAKAMLQHSYSYTSAMLSMLFHHAIYALPPCYLHSSAPLKHVDSALRVMLQQSGNNALNVK